VCIGWGSLIWDPGTLPVKGKWSSDGPLLPLEFARESRDGRLTLVLVPAAAPMRSYWVDLSSKNIESARAALASREQSTDINSIGVWSRGTISPTVGAAAIGIWAGAREFWGVVWTALKPGFRSRRGSMPTADDVIAYLRDLKGERRRRAEEYIRRAPREIDTSYRRRIEAEFGWAAA